MRRHDERCHPARCQPLGRCCL
ncbi:MAG: hypothetical protein DRP64_14170 [Verrucomicrobia bacterium]|nr:MAG: hypothetical protein DRP64_14170 [Verrucomicrobiota bacterium]